MKISIQGYKGSYHEQVARTYFGDKAEILPANSFDLLANQLFSGASDFAVMAIENNIAGTILQNYRILRTYNFAIIGEVYLRIQHCLLGKKGARLEQIQKVYSHPMAINQCLRFFADRLPHAELIETADTALSALHLSGSESMEAACIAGKYCAQIYNLEVLKEGLESYEDNYTRFFILSRLPSEIPCANKASVYLPVRDKRGELLKVLQIINDHGVNMSKLQSYPLPGSLREYYFHIDLEFEGPEVYRQLKSTLSKNGYDVTELGVYRKAEISVPEFVPSGQNDKGNHEKDETVNLGKA